jgi:hypothetical protein
MKKCLSLFVGLFAIAFIAPSLSQANAQDCDQVTRLQLRSMLVELGYEVKDIVTTPGSEKFSITTNNNALDIPIGLELSPSLRYIWLTVNLGPAPADTSRTHGLLMRENGKTQPSLFYVTSSGLLMMGLPVDNRGVTNTSLRERIETISKNVGSTKDIWQRKP